MFWDLSLLLVLFISSLIKIAQNLTLIPFITVPLFVLIQYTGKLTMRPFIVPILKAYSSPIELDNAAALISFSDNLAQILFLCLIRFTGKRRLYLFMTFGIFISTLVISCYGFMVLPSGYSSFNQQSESFHLENTELAWIPLVCLFLWSFFSRCGFIGKKIGIWKMLNFDFNLFIVVILLTFIHS